MNPMFSLRRSVSRVVAGAFFAVLFAVVSVPALALKVTKVGSPPGEPLSFTITLDNTTGPVATGTPLVLDPLPGMGTVVWTLGDTGGFFCEMLTGLDFPHLDWGTLDFPDNQQVINCDGSGLDVGESTSIVVNGTAAQSTCTALSLVNEVFVVTGNYEPMSAIGTIDIGGGGADCRMTGGGSIFAEIGNKKTRVTHGFEIRCNADDPRQNLEINWPGTGKSQNNFHLTDMISAGCTDDPAVDQKPPRAPFDTYAGTGVGTCNGQEAWIDFVFVDGGEPGTKDYALYSISGACTLEAEGEINRGNQQAH